MIAATAATAPNWTDYADLVLELVICLAIIAGVVLLARLLRAQRQAMSRGFESIESEIAEVTAPPTRQRT